MSMETTRVLNYYQTGQWEVSTKGKENQKIDSYCIVSGGYVMVGVRTTVSDNNNNSTNRFGEVDFLDEMNCCISDFAEQKNNANGVIDFIKKNLNEQILNEVSRCVEQWILQKNKVTSGPTN